MSTIIETRGLDELIGLFARAPEIADDAAKLAVNDAARFARRLASKEVRKQIAFKPRYLGSEADGADANLAVAKYASTADDDAVVRARDPATSLARFATSAVRFGKGGRGIRVRVSPGRTEKLERAFFVRLKRGTSDISAENYNLGLAVRLKKGERIENKRVMRPFGAGAYLLYAPSVAQVFDDVALQISDDVSNKLLAEFVRHFDRMTSE